MSAADLAEQLVQRDRDVTIRHGRAAGFGGDDSDSTPAVPADADKLLVEIKLERKEVARIRAEATRLVVEAARLRGASDTDE